MPSLLSPSRVALLLIAVILTTGCSSAPKPATQAAAAPATAPLMIPEATLPAGYPKPGLVNEIVVKEYPASRIARVWRDDEVITDNDAMFMQLFKHIQKHDIAMTSPVQIEYPENAALPTTAMPVISPVPGPATRPSAMSFVYPLATLGMIGQDDDVEVVDQPAMTVISIGVRGEQSVAQFTANLAKLDGWLHSHREYTRAGAPRFLGYNSPMVPDLVKFGEVQLPVKKAD